MSMEKKKSSTKTILIPGKTHCSTFLKSFETTDSPLAVNGLNGRIRVKAWKSANVVCAPR